jgi:hypothetical protein
MKIWAWGSVVATTAAALVACGGGGGGNGGGNGGGAVTTSSSSSSSSSSSTSSGAGGGAPACGIYWEDPTKADRAACETLMEDSCCGELQACAPGTDCDALLTCANACAATDSTCVTNCINGHQQGLTDYQTLQSCFYQNAYGKAECSWPICTSGQATADEKCAACVGGDAGCCKAVTDCAADATCTGCTATPTGTGCDTNTLFQALNTCFDTTCGPKCVSSICGSQLGYTGSNSCNYCLTQQCCTPFDACQNDTTCKACLMGTGDKTACASNTLFKAFTDCRDTPGATTCGDSGECN